MQYKNKFCVICGDSFKPSSGIQVSCSDICSKQDRKNKAKTKWDNQKKTPRKIEKNCISCGKLFIDQTGRTGQPNKKYCSKRCGNIETTKQFRLKNNLPQVRSRSALHYSFKCIQCGKNFKAKVPTKKTCSLSCSNKAWSKKNPEKVKEYSKKFLSNEENRKRTLKQQAIYNKSEKGIAKRKIKVEQYKKDGTAKRHRKKALETLKKNPERWAITKIIHNCRRRIQQSVKVTDNKIITSNIELLGCTSQELKRHLAKQFKPEMNWENYGTYWEVDHIVPISRFDVSIRSERNKANHYTNLQPLEGDINRKLGAKK